jgi:nucleoside-diphosphate-sugar epimerase
VGRALVARLVGDGVRVLATARTVAAGREVVEAGAEPLHTDAGNLREWTREAADAEAVFHLGLPRLDPPLRRGAARRRAKPAAAAAEAVAEVAGGRPVVMLSSAFAYREGGDPAADDDPVTAPAAVAAAALAAEAALAPAAPRIVRVPWIHGNGGIARDLVAGLRMRRHRIVGPGDNRWSMLGAGDAAAALVAALGAPPGVYSAAEEEIPTQVEVLRAICAVPGHRMPDRVPPAMAALSMGGAMSEALGRDLAVRTGRLAAHGWAPRERWRDTVTRLAETPLRTP